MYVFGKVAFVYAIVAIVSAENSTFVTCGNKNSDDVKSVIKSTVDRLMELRHQDWGWTNTPEVVLGLQLAAQEQFFGREKALDTMKTEIDNTLHKMSIGKLGLYVMAVQASCADPRKFGGRDLVQILEKRIKRQFYYDGSQQTTPLDNFFGLALGSLCVNRQAVRTWVVRKLLNGQNEDGSFGKAHSVDEAAQNLLALECIKRENRTGPVQRKLTVVIAKLVTFLQSNIVADGDNVWISNKYSSPSALAVKESSEVQPQDWQCRDILRSLAVGPTPSDQEASLSQRLPVLGGLSYLNLKYSHWRCQATVPLPVDYEPTCDPETPQTCNPPPTAATPMTFISVRLTIFPQKPGETVTITADFTAVVPAGSTLLTAMEQAQQDGQMTFKTAPSTWGAYITSMQDVEADPEAREYWAMTRGATGESLPQGISSYIPADGEQIIFRLKSW